MREPQCESVKRYSPVSYIERKPIPSLRSQAVIRQSLCENAVGSVGVRERGERTAAEKAAASNICIPGRSDKLLK